MSHYNDYDEKPKNDFEKPKLAPWDPTYAPRERGGCLTVFLVFIMGANVLALVYLCSLTTQVSRYSSASAMPILALAFGFQSAVLACAAGMWNWKRWGYYGLAAVYVIEAGIMLLAGNLSMVVGAVIALGILFGLVNSKIEMFE